ncbi:MAG: tRNA (adenosine(37)-N6)-dimethylallyltransferase MiaA [Actinomycetales bacterium]|nr:tRNA (adenosine(37)-N6)-dimethylallyltransferase MiaA [Actinomycetales bacterium]
MNRVAVALVGATASGKSSLAHAIAREYPDVAVLAVDAMTVYRDLDIGTAKPTADQRREVPYYLLDLVEPEEEFTVARFQRAAREATSTIWSQGRRAIFAGGTGLYQRAVLDDYQIPGRYPDVRHELEARWAAGEALHEELVREDPLAASRMEPTNERRVVRALEVTIGSGRPFSSFGPGLAQYGRIRIVQVGLRVPMDELDRRIEARFRRWMDEGLLDEVRRLAKRPAGLSRTARQAVGYRELLAHVEDGVDLEQCVRDAITHSRRLARRQRSWFERDPRVEWFDSPDAAGERLERVLNGPDGFVRE